MCFCAQLSPDWGIDYESYEWRKLDPSSEECKTMVKEYFLWEGEFKNEGKDFNQGKIFKWGPERAGKKAPKTHGHINCKHHLEKKKWSETEFALSGALNDFVVTCKIKHFPECHLWYFLCSLFFVFFSPSFEFAHEWFTHKQPILRLLQIVTWQVLGA